MGAAAAGPAVVAAAAATAAHRSIGGHVGGVGGAAQAAFRTASSLQFLSFGLLGSEREDFGRHFFLWGVPAKLEHDRKSSSVKPYLRAGLDDLSRKI